MTGFVESIALVSLPALLADLPAGWMGWDIVISAGIFVSISLLVVSLFGQSGEVHLSPQREAALATGHSDRKTVFEMPFLSQPMWVLLSMAHRLSWPRSAKPWIARNLVAAGSPNYYTAEEYLALSMLTGLVMATFLEIFYLIISEGQFSVFVPAFGLLVGMGLTLYQLHSKALKRMHAISRRLPYVLDLVSLAMGAGATFTEAIHTVVRENTDDPLHVELKALLAEIELGTTRHKALENFAQRTPLEGVRTTAASVIQAEELGTPLHNVLHDQATLLRLQRSVHAENAAAVASVRILLPCLLIVIAVILTIFAPAIVRAIQNGGLF